MAAATPPVFERYALYLLAILVAGLYTWGIARTVGGGSTEEHADTYDPAVRPTVAASVSRQPPILIDYELSDPPSTNLLGPQLHRSNLPRDLRKLNSISERKRLFIKLMMPLVTRANQRVLEQRRRLLDIEQRQTVGFALSADDISWLARLGEEYGVEEIDFAVLKARVDVVPPSLALAQAAEESGWGTSRFAVEGNALFGQRVYRGGRGMVPLRRDAESSHRVRTFDDLQESVSRYLHNLNTHWAYERFRALRIRMRAANRTLEGRELVGTLDKYSERGADYIKAIRSIISFNGLTAFDRAQRRGDQGLIPTPGA